SAVVTFLLAIAITWPLRKIAQGAKAVTGRDFSHYISLDTTVEEISRLGNVFNEMIFSLNEHMLESMAGGVLTINMDGLITNFNSAAELILDCNSKEAVGRHYSSIFPPCPENEKFSASIDSAAKHHQAGAAQKMEILTRTNKKIAITLSTSLLKSEVDTLLGVVVTFQDIDQMQELEEQMRYTDKLASLARLSRGIAHEIRNPLGSIKGLAQLLLESGDLDKKKKEYLEIMVKESDRLDKTVGDLLTFSEQGDLVLKPEPVRPEQISQEILSMVSPEAEIKNIQIIREFPDEKLPLVMVDKKRFAQAGLNIIYNGFQAMPQGGSLTLRLEEKDDYVCFIFKDTGIGIKKADLKMLFDPFFTTREKGTGLGLSITYQIISAHSGHIKVDTQEQKGSVFTVSLPVAKITKRFS
ncbi:MAG: PAS domain-containing protein, partial [Candidatus Omnitrophica bacterium]|nr:PAS domain-containing protein [Candidatus Omnitrophota bacterium]